MNVVVSSKNNWHLYTVIHKKRGSTFVIITLENSFDFYNFLHCYKQEEHFCTHMKNMFTSPK